MRQLTVAIVASMLAKEIEQFAQFYIGDTSSSAQPGQTIQVGSVIALCWQPISSGSALVVNTGLERIAFSPKITTQTNNRIIQNVRRRKRIKKETLPTYSILYEVEKEQTLEYWAASESYETLVHSMDKTLTIESFVPDGYYLAIWGDLDYSRSEDFFEDLIIVTDPSPSYGRVSVFRPSFYGFYNYFISGFSARIPKPIGLNRVFTGEYFPGSYINVYDSVFSDSPIEYNLNSRSRLESINAINPDYRVIIAIQGAGLNQIFEYTGFNVPNQDFFQTFWIPPEAITSKGYSKEDLIRAPGGRIYAPVNAPGWKNSHYYTVALIPWGQEPGPAFPKRYRLSFLSGSNADFAASLLIPGSNPYFDSGHEINGINPEYWAGGDSLSMPLIYDGRNYFQPNEPQQFYVRPDSELYWSTRGSDSVFFMKFALDPQSNPSQSLPAPRFQYQDKVYKQVQSDGTVSSLDSTSIFDVSNPNNSTPPDPTDPNPFSVLKVIRYGFKEWKGYLLSMDRRFYEVISPRFVATFTEFQVEAFSQNFWGRNKVAAQYILTPGMYVGENLYISIPFSEVTDFLLDEENEAESSSGFNFSIVPYSIVPAEGAIPTNAFSAPSTLFRNYTVSLDSESQLEVEIIKPVEFTKFLKDAAAEENGVQGVRIIDIVPLVDG
jgi:hypothetical protein